MFLGDIIDEGCVDISQSPTTTTSSCDSCHDNLQHIATPLDNQADISDIINRVESHGDVRPIGGINHLPSQCETITNISNILSDNISSILNILVFKISLMS